MINKRFFMGILSFWLVFGLFVAGCKQPVEYTTITVDTYTVSYNANGASGTVPATQTVDAGASVAVAGQGGLSNPGKTFNGWNTNAAGTGTAYAAGSSITVNANVTLYAQWENESSSAISVGLWAAFANGSAWETTTHIQLNFNRYDPEITGLTENDIILSGMSGIHKGSLIKLDVNTFTLPIYGFTEGGTVEVTVSKSGYKISGIPQSVTIYYAAAVTFESVIADGNETQTTTQLTLTFSQPISGLTADDITFPYISDSGIRKGTLSCSGPSYILPISGFSNTEQFAVDVNKVGFNIISNYQIVTIFHYIPPAINFIITLSDMHEWELTEQTAQAASNVNTVFTVNETYSAYQWYLDGILAGSGPTYTFNKPSENYQLVVVVTNSNGESRSGRCRITVSN